MFFGIYFCNEKIKSKHLPFVLIMGIARMGLKLEYLDLERKKK